ncbi:hypothetical protein BN1423_400006 [Carnobacterium maltaromaticum]|nr:hypothetical protein BN1423_400006 [Carnobacterium maltaromaticum]
MSIYSVYFEHSVRQAKYIGVNKILRDSKCLIPKNWLDKFIFP